MLKHVQISPLRSRADSLSLRSSTSSYASSMCGSPEPITDIPRTPSRASSYSSLNDQLPQTTIKVYTNCLKIDIEYKTLGIQWDTTSKDVIMQLLRRLKMRHRDPRLFYLSMEVSVRRTGVKTFLVLDDDTRPAILQACHPKGESRFCLQLKPGGLIRVHTSALQPSSQYKSLVISEETTSDELLQLLLSCYNSLEPVEQFSIYEVCPGQEYQRKLHPDDLPLRAQVERAKRNEICHFLVRRNPNYLRRCQILTTLDEVVKNYNIATAVVNTTTDVVVSHDNSPASPNDSFDSDISSNNSSLSDSSLESFSNDLRSLLNTSDNEHANSSKSSSSGISDTSFNCEIQSITTGLTTWPKIEEDLKKNCCYKPFKTTKKSLSNNNLCTLERNDDDLVTYTYNPVYNIREIKRISYTFPSSPTTPTTPTSPTSIKSFSGNDKNQFTHFDYDNSIPAVLSRENFRSHNKSSLLLARENSNDSNEKTMRTKIKATTTLAGEEVNNDPAKGLGHFVYI